MSELMINPAPTPPSSGAGGANALSPSDAASKSGETARASAEGGAELPFAAVLKSRMDKKAAETGGANSASSAVSAPQTDAEDLAISIDISALLSLFVVNPAGATGVAVPPPAAEESSPGEKLLLEHETAAELASTQIFAALSSTPGPVAANPSGRAAIMDAASRQENLETIGETLTAAGGISQTPGKMASDAAINADSGSKGGEQKTLELPANDFHAVMERAAAMTPAVAGTTNGSSSNPNLRIDTPLGQAGWHDEMGQKLTWMIGNNRQQADLVLNPPQLGRVEVSLTMNGDQATAIFTSSNPAVREALENSLHRLREVLADAGVTLGQTQVGSESPNQPSQKNEPDLGRNEGMDYASTVPLPVVTAGARADAGRSMIDIFA